MKKFKIHLEPEAIEDIRENRKWYNEQQKGLGMLFYNSVISQIDKIEYNPLAYPIRYENVITVSLDKFPYLIHYYIDIQRKKIVILGILHTSRNPEIWRKRYEIPKI